jgi:hypothetical protein
MMKHISCGVFAILCIGALATTGIAQQRDSNRTLAQQSRSAASQPAGQVTLVGCLYRESAIPGRSVTQRGGMLDDYILADAAISRAPGATGAVGTAGTVPAAGKLYEVERIADERLNPLVGKRVEVMGYIDADQEHMTGAAPDLTDLPEFEATSIREVSGTCPATPKL